MKKSLAKFIQTAALILLAAVLAGCPTSITQTGNQNNADSGTGSNVTPP